MVVSIKEGNIMWTYKQPVEIIFGVDQVKLLGDFIVKKGYKNGLLISDPFFTINGMAEKIRTYADGSLNGIFTEFGPNPTIEQIDNCAEVIRTKQYNFVVALGGGSALDCAKAACSVCKKENSVSDYLAGAATVSKDHIPIIAIPTTAGTGSEVTKVSVISDPDKKVKQPLASDNFYPEAAIIDPVLTMSLPSLVTASTGLDVLAHAIEGFWSIHHQPICDAMALHACKLVFSNLEQCCDKEKCTIENRTAMCEASVMAGIAFAYPKTSGPHACSYPLTSVYGIPHGEACAFTLDWFLRVNATADGGRLNQFSKDLGFQNAEMMADRILDLKKTLGLRTEFSQIGIQDKDIPEFARLCMHPNMLNNPVKMTEADIIRMCNDIKKYNISKNN